MRKSAMIGGRVEQSVKERLVGLKDVLARKTRLKITETCILEALIEEADIHALTRYFIMKP